MRKVILLLIACLLILLPFQAFAGEFSDTKKHWALMEVNEIASAGIVDGYPDKTFKPQNTVTHLEALTMIIKSLGLEAQAKKLDLTKGNYNFPEGITWGKEYLALAADKAIISKEKMSYLKPNVATNRAEIAVMFANALNLSADESELTFADNEQIPEVFRSSVAGIVKIGIMQGQTGNKFAPGEMITRAETVTIISRLFTKGMINPNPSNYFINKIAEIDKTNQLIVIEKSESAIYPYLLTTDCLIYRDGKKATLNDFQKNDNVKIVLNNEGRIKFLANITEQFPTNNEASENNSEDDTQDNTENNTQNNSENTEQTTVPVLPGSGIIDSVIYGYPIKVIITKSDGESALYTLESVVKVSVNGVTKDTTVLAKGSVIEYDYTDNKISEVRVHSASLDNNSDLETDKAYIINIWVNYLTLHYEDGGETEYDIDESVNFFKNNQRISLSMLKKGDLVEVTKYSDKNKLISVTIMSGESRKVFGEIVSNVDECITIEDYDDEESSYDVDSDAEITNADGIELSSVKDLDVDDDVEITLDSSNKVVAIKVDRKSSSISGTILSVTTSGSYTLKLDQSNGLTKKYYVSDDVNVKHGTSSLDYDELSVGNEIKIYLDNSKVVKIELESDDRVIKGEVTSLDKEGDYGITIKRSDGTTKKYDVDDDVNVKEDSSSCDFSDLRKGDEVEISLDEDDVVTKIEITDDSDSSVSGIITDFDWDDQEISIEDEDDDETDYDLEDDAEVTKDDEEIDPEDLLIGAEVELEIEDDVVVEIVVKDDEDIEIKGEITKVYDDEVKIEQSNGNEFKLYFESSPSLEDEDGDDIEIDDLDEGMDVQIILRDGKIRKLEVT